MLAPYQHFASGVLEVALQSGVKFPKVSVDFYSKFHQNKEKTVSTFQGQAPERLKNLFVSSLKELPDQVQIDTSVQKGDTLAPISVNNSQKQLSWDSKCVVFIWGSWSQTCQKYFQKLKHLASKTSGLRLISICLDENLPEHTEAIESYWVKGFQQLSEQALDLAEIPTYLLVQDSVVIEKRDPIQTSLQSDLFCFSHNVSLKQVPERGGYLENLNLQTYQGREYTLDFTLGKFFLLVFAKSKSIDSFMHHLAQVFESHPMWHSQLEVFLLSPKKLNSTLECFSKLVYQELPFLCKKQMCVLVKDNRVLLNCSANSALEKHLKEFFEPQSIITQTLYESAKSDIFDYFEMLPKSQFCPFPSVLMTVSKTFDLNHTSSQSHSVSMFGTYLKTHRSTLEEFYSYLVSIFPSAENYFQFQEGYQIEPGVNCSFCEVCLTTPYYVCCVCKPQINVCSNCVHGHPCYLVEETSKGLGELWWGGELKFGEACCDECSEKVSLIRFKCAHCKDFDLCGSCFGSRSHDSSHIFICSS